MAADRLAGVLQGLDVPAPVMGWLDDMDLVEGVLDGCKTEHPDRATEIDAVFSAALRPGRLPDAWYVLHVRRLVDKVLAGEPLDTPTIIDCALLISALSLSAPIAGQYVWWLWQDADLVRLIDGAGVDMRGETGGAIDRSIYREYCDAMGKRLAWRERNYRLALARRRELAELARLDALEVVHV